jgi:hypothetical protein
MINKQTDEFSILRLEDISEVFDTINPQGDTFIGRNLRERILQPMVYEPLIKGTLERPLLVSILTDGAPSPEGEEELENAIVQCGDTSVDSGYPRDCMPLVSLICVLVVFGLLSMLCRCQVLNWPNWVSGSSEVFYAQT